MTLEEFRNVIGVYVMTDRPCPQCHGHGRISMASLLTQDQASLAPYVQGRYITCDKCGGSGYQAGYISMDLFRELLLSQDELRDSSKKIDTNEEGLLPCEHCGGNAHVNFNSQYNMYEVVCMKCLARGGMAKTEDEAKKLWNDRVH